MLTRFIKIQLVLFTILTIIALVALGWYYLRLPSVAGIGQYKLYADLPAVRWPLCDGQRHVSRYHHRQGHRGRTDGAGRQGHHEHRQPLQDSCRCVGERALGVGDR